MVKRRIFFNLESVVMGSNHFNITCKAWKGRRFNSIFLKENVKRKEKSAALWGNIGPKWITFSRVGRDAEK